MSGDSPTGSRRSRSRRPTLADVARLAGVSTTTASFVINNRPAQISERTRERVLAAVRQLHYTRNAHVTALRRRRAQTLGIHFHDYQGGQFARDPVLGPVLIGVAQAARSHAYHLVVFTGAPDRDGEVPVEAFLDGRADGLIYVHAPPGDRLMAELAEVELPCVVVFNRYAPPNLGFVDADNITGAQEAVRYLAALGHRRIAHFTHGIPNSNLEDRIHGYRLALEACGLPFDPRLLVRGEPWLDAAAALAVVRRLERPPTAVIAFNDALAVQVIHAARACGLRVPEDLSVVGFDNSTYATVVTPALTTMAQPLVEMGRLAATSLIQLVGGAPPSECRHLAPMQLIERASTAPATARRRSRWR